MTFFLRGRTILTGTDVSDSRPFASLDAALAEAKARLNLGDQVVWIMEHTGRVVLSSSEVLHALAGQAPKPAFGPA